jgi:hypothetical protein
MTGNRWDVSFLESMRKVGDPEADAVVSDVIKRHDIHLVNKMMLSIVANDDIVPDDMPKSVRDYLKKTAVLPDWADMELIERGEKFFDLHWPIVVTLLFCASLPSAYAACRGAQVLFLTQRITKHIHRRIFETAQFIMDVMAPRGLEPDGTGIRAAQKVRLLHTTIRSHIEYMPEWKEKWNPEWGVPINQEDLAGTLMTFSVQVLRGMKRFQIPVTQEQEEAYMHAWKVVGHIMGVQHDLMPENYQDALDLALTIFDSQMEASTAGVELTKALMDFMQRLGPARLLPGLAATMIRHSVDKDVADMLDVPKSNWTAILLSAELFIFRTLERLGLIDSGHSRLLQRFSFDIVQELVKIDRGGNRGLFRIPPELRSPI